MSLSNQLLQYTLHLADDTLVLGHRNSEWTGHGPILEQDIAISNIALDLVGQARNFYQYAGQQSGATEDQLAYLRDGWDFTNSLLVEQTNGDWARTILRQFFFSVHQVGLYERLATGTDATLAAIAAKAYKEAVYHQRWSSEWVIRLGDGTEESHRRMSKAVDELWKFTGELYTPASYEQWAASTGVGPELSSLKGAWEEKVREVFAEAGLSWPVTGWMQTGGKEGRHTEHLGYILAEMQYLQRAYPGCEW